MRKTRIRVLAASGSVAAAGAIALSGIIAATAAPRATTVAGSGIEQFRFMSTSATKPPVAFENLVIGVVPVHL